MDKITHEMRVEHWKPIIKACNSSELSKKQWCIQNDVPEKAFYYWQRRIRQKVLKPTSELNLPQTTTNFVQLQPAPLMKQQPISENNAAATIHINDCVIKLSETASESFIKRLFGALTYVQ
jgi:putative transposase